MEVLENIKEAIKLLQDNEEYYQELNGEGGLISVADQKIDYWLHYIEFNSVDAKKMCRVHKELKKLRNERRKYKNDAELIKVFKDNEQKLVNTQNREFLLAQVCKTDAKQQNAKYGSMVYSEEEINEILGIKESKQ
jgi:hypothetical protein